MKNTLFVHGKATDGTRFTIAANLVKSASTIEANFAYSICSKTDSFNKKIGRSIAEGRAKKASGLYLTFQNNAEGYDNIITKMFDLCKQMVSRIGTYKRMINTSK